MSTSDPYASHRIRSNLRAFAIGKALSAPASFFLVFLLASVTPAPEYAAYVAAAAMLEIGIAIGSFGMDWLAQTVLPSVRMKGTSRQFLRALLALAGLQAFPYALFGLLFTLFAQPVSHLLSGVVPVEVFRIYGMILAVEGTARMLRDQIMGALMLQRLVQILQMFRVIVLLTTTLTLRHLDIGVTAKLLACAELGASLLTLVGASITLTRYVMANPGRDGDETSLRPWLSHHSFRLAANAYLSFLLTLSLGPEVVTAIIARMLGAEATASFGFAARVVDQVRRFLPMDLLWVVIRPALIGRFEGAGRRPSQLGTDIGTVLRANLLLLGGVVLLFLGVGDTAVAFSTRGNVLLPHLFLGLLVLQVAGHSVRRSVELTSFMIGRSHCFLIGSFASLLVPTTLFLFLWVYPSLYLAPLAMVLAETVFSGIVFACLRRGGWPMTVDWGRWARLPVIVLACAAMTAMLSRYFPGIPGIVFAAAMGGILYLALLLLLRVISRSDFELLIRVARFRMRPVPQTR